MANDQVALKFADFRGVHRIAILSRTATAQVSGGGMLAAGSTTLTLPAEIRTVMFRW